MKKCPYCGSDEYEVYDIVVFQDVFTEQCSCNKCNKMFDIEYQYKQTIKIDKE